MSLDRSEFLVFVDESGDHGLQSIDPTYPVFVLAFCIFRKTDYARQLLPLLTEFKFRYFGHDQVVLHEREIRKDTGDFAILRDETRKTAFLAELTELIDSLPMAIIATAIRRAYEVIERKLDRNPSGQVKGWGLKIFP